MGLPGAASAVGPRQSIRTGVIIPGEPFARGSSAAEFERRPRVAEWSDPGRIAERSAFRRRAWSVGYGMCVVKTQTVEIVNICAPEVGCAKSPVEVAGGSSRPSEPNVVGVRRRTPDAARGVGLSPAAHRRSGRARRPRDRGARSGRCATTPVVSPFMAFSMAFSSLWRQGSALPSPRSRARAKRAASATRREPCAPLASRARRYPCVHAAPRPSADSVHTPSIPARPPGCCSRARTPPLTQRPDHQKRPAKSMRT